DPDRLFLLGALLFFDGQVEKAKPFLETAYRLAGGGDHIAAFFATPASKQAPADASSGKTTGGRADAPGRRQSPVSEPRNAGQDGGRPMRD
ncbi:MAG: hypothetical protein D6725_06640, partial [Planctomycetota bacterium]